MTLTWTIAKSLHEWEAAFSAHTYEQKGVAMRESARMAIILLKQDSDWKIAAWAWTGTFPKVAE